MSKRAWMVRAERGGRLYDVFKDRGVVAIGWHELGSLALLTSREAITASVRKVWPDWKNQTVAMAAGQIHRFRSEIAVGDTVLTYDPSRRVYLVGTVTGEYIHDETVDPDDPNVRQVAWREEVSRDLLTVSSKNTLGSISTLFLLSPDVISDVERAMVSHKPAVETIEAETEAAEQDVFLNIQSKAIEFTKDQVASLDWSQMQDLVAGLLRALGYKTRVSPAGPDQGKKISWLHRMALDSSLLASLSK